MATTNASNEEQITAKTVIAQVVKIAILGGCAMVGVRAVEWVIPAPETKVLICMASDADKIEACKSLEELTE